MSQHQIELIIQAVAILYLLLTVRQLNIQVAKHQKALKWFANHIKIDPHWRSEPMPEALASLVEESTEDQVDLK